MQGGPQGPSGLTERKKRTVPLLDEFTKFAKRNY
jgi:hypothetical protein